MPYTEDELRLGIEIYKTKVCHKPECEKCESRGIDVKYDPEVSNYYCDTCLGDSLRDDPQGMFDCVGSEVKRLLANGAKNTVSKK